MALLPEDKPPNHERWIISYADFTTLLLATFVVMYAVSNINSSKFQEMAEAFSTAFIGRTVNVNDSGFAAAEKSPFNFMPSPVHVPVVTREVQIKNLPPSLLPENMKNPATGGPQEQLRPGEQTANSGAFKAPPGALQQEVRQRAEALDAAYEKLRQALAGLIGTGQVRVSLRSLGVVIDINEVLLFNSGKAELTGQALPLIDQVAGILKDLPYQIQVNGFTDNKPIHTAQFDSNWDLSATRAIAVVKRFVTAGIDPALLVGAGFGEYHPVAANDTAEGMAMNRRVSIVVAAPIESAKEVTSKLRLFGGEQGAAAPASPAPPPAVVPSAVIPPRPAPGASP